MTLGNPIIRYLSGSTLFLVLTVFFNICIGPAYAAPEPGTVTIVVNSEPTNLDPTDCMSGVVGPLLMKNVAETLTIFNHADSSISPGLATSWKQIDDTTWHFFLRKGVKFHDGRDFNAEAVVFSFKRLHEKRLQTITQVKFFSSRKIEVKALDSHTAEIKTDKPEPLLLTLMGTVAMCSPNTPLEKLTRNPIGTGPYRFVKWDAGTQIILDRFGGYWGKRPQMEKAVYVWRTESSVRAAMVALGEADLAPDIARENANRPDMDHSYLTSETTMLRFGGAWEPPLNDRRVRMALNYAIDRDAIRGSILSKDVIPATQLVVPGIFGYNPDLKVWPYDPQKAKQLVDEARKDGVTVDKEITLVARIGQYPHNQELMEAIMTMYKAVGLNAKIKMGERNARNGYRLKPYITNAGPFLMNNQHDNNSGDMVFTAFSYYHCDGEQSSMCDKTVDDLIERAQVATGERRRGLWQAAMKRIREEIIPDAMLYHMVTYCRVGNRINFKPSIATNIEIPLSQITFK